MAKSKNPTLGFKVDCNTKQVITELSWKYDVTLSRMAEFLLLRAIRELYPEKWNNNLESIYQGMAWTYDFPRNSSKLSLVESESECKMSS